jgi:GT2 family glycosyltransferase
VWPIPLAWQLGANLHTLSSVRDSSTAQAQGTDEGRTTLAYSTVIATKDRASLAFDAVRGMLAQSSRPVRIVVVDASEPPLAAGKDARQAVVDGGSELVVVHASPSTARQRNLGVERVHTPLVLLLDDDVSLQPDYVEVLLRRWERDGLYAWGAMVGVPEYMPPQGRLARLLRRALMLHYQAPHGGATSFRRSRKLRLVPVPAEEVTVPACGAGYGLFRTDLLRRHRFDETFPGYAPGEDLEMSSRLSAEAPILQVPSVHYLHEWEPRERTSPARWHHQGRRETYFRLRHLGRAPATRAAFALSLLAETGVAAVESIRERNPRHVIEYVRGVLQTLRESRR